jgi:cytochrome P450
MTGTAGSTAEIATPEDFVPPVRTCPFAAPTLYTQARDAGAPQRVTIWDGSRPWLITRHDQVQEALRSPAFSADVTNPHFPNTSASQPGTEGNIFFRKDGAAHLDIRRLLNPAFTTKAVEKWRPRIIELVEESIDKMLLLPRPVDAIEHFALIIPTVVICELLGVDQADSPVVHHASHLVSDTTAPLEEKMAAHKELDDLLRGYVHAKRTHPDSSLLSTLANEHVANGTISEAEAAGLGNLVIGAGHETTANMIGLSILSLLREPEQRAKLVAEPEKYAGTASEEELRYWSIVQSEPRRVAIEDVEIGGVTIKAGEGIICGLAAANRDPEVFSDPEELDITRAERKHVAFGFGLHQCLGQNLSRVEMQEALPRLFQRIPDLRLAVPEDELTFSDPNLTFGVVALPVTWGDA